MSKVQTVKYSTRRRTNGLLTTYGAFRCYNRLTAQKILASLPKSRQPYSTAYWQQRRHPEPWWLTSFVALEQRSWQQRSLAVAGLVVTSPALPSTPHASACSA